MGAVAGRNPERRRSDEPRPKYARAPCLAMSATAWLMVTTLVAVTTTPIDDVGHDPLRRRARTSRRPPPCRADRAPRSPRSRPRRPMSPLSPRWERALGAVPDPGARVLSARAAQREAATRDAWRKRTEQARRGAAERVRAEKLRTIHGLGTPVRDRQGPPLLRVGGTGAGRARSGRTSRCRTSRCSVQPRATGDHSGGTSMGGGWAALRRCESGGNYGAVSSSGTYRGAYQFSRSTWNSVARGSYPHLVGVDPAAAAPADQDAMALALYRSSARPALAPLRPVPLSRPGQPSRRVDDRPLRPARSARDGTPYRSEPGRPRPIWSFAVDAVAVAVPVPVVLGSTPATYGP